MDTNPIEIQKPRYQKPLVVFLLLILLIFFGVFETLKERSLKQQGAVLSKQDIQKTEKNNWSIPLPENGEKYNKENFVYCTGKIEAIEGNTITIKAEKAQNLFLTSNKQFKIIIGEQTKILTASEFPATNDPNKKERKVLSVQDLSVGGYLIVKSQENLKDKNSFTADEIYYISYNAP